jgi:hypothetical protein
MTARSSSVNSNKSYTCTFFRLGFPRSLRSLRNHSAKKSAPKKPRSLRSCGEPRLASLGADSLEHLQILFDNLTFLVGQLEQIVHRGVNLGF